MAATHRRALDETTAATIATADLDPDTTRLFDLVPSYALPRTSLVLARRNLHHARATTNPEAAATALNRLGIALRGVGRPTEALTALQEAVALGRALAANNPARQPKLAAALNNLGITLHELVLHA